MDYEKPDWLKEYEARFEAAMAKSDALPDGLHVGKIVSTRVADGHAYYQIVKVNKKSVRVIWRRDLALDGWKDAVLQDGGSFEKSRIEPMVRLGDYWRRLQKRKS